MEKINKSIHRWLYSKKNHASLTTKQNLSDGKLNLFFYTIYCIPPLVILLFFFFYTLKISVRKFYYYTSNLPSSLVDKPATFLCPDIHILSGYFLYFKLLLGSMTMYLFFPLNLYIVWAISTKIQLLCIKIWKSESKKKKKIKIFLIRSSLTILTVQTYNNHWELFVGRYAAVYVYSCSIYVVHMLIQC